MNILLLSDSPDLPSAYATQTAMLAPALEKLGHRVVIYTPRKAGLPSKFKGMPLVGYRDVLYGRNFGEDMIDAHCDRYKCDIVITMKDPYSFSPMVMKGLAHAWFPVAPVDGDPVSALNKAVLKYCVRPIALTEQGAKQLREIGLDPFVIPHFIDPAVFRPAPQSAARKAKGIPEDAFVALVVADNTTAPSRKNWEQLIPAWAAFVDIHPDSILMVHTCTTDERGGVDLQAMFAAYGIPRRNLYATPPYEQAFGVSARNMAEMYQCADVTVAIGNEGFGMTTLESQACGVPVIGIDWAATPELLRGGYLIPQQQGETWFTDAGTFFFRPFIQAVHAALEAALLKRPLHLAKAQELSALMSKYHIDNVIPLWKSALEDIEKLVQGEL